MALGHVRLSISGLVNGDQPIVNANGDVHCVVNGEFYGYKAIRTQLAAEDVRLTTDTDSEIALHLYEKHGAEFVHHLRGEFAIVIADELRRCLIAARDRFGIKPLFYTVVNGAVFPVGDNRRYLVVNGGDITSIATAIAAKKTPGCGTYGSIITSRAAPRRPRRPLAHAQRASRLQSLA
jgi:asparagine synthetase B (glutamine-hydrolysing)